MDAYVTVKHPGTPAPLGVELTLPCVKRVQQTFQETNPNRTRHSHSGRKFVTPCGAATRTEVYTITALFANQTPMHWYVKDGDVVTAKFVKGTVSPEDVYTVTQDCKVVWQGFDWNNESEDSEEITLVFEAVGTATYEFKANTDDALPHDTW
jgi:hypothetical protein